MLPGAGAAARSGAQLCLHCCIRRQVLDLVYEQKQQDGISPCTGKTEHPHNTEGLRHPPCMLGTCLISGAISAAHLLQTSIHTFP